MQEHIFFFIKASVAHYGIEWPCMALCGLVWLYVALYVLFYLILRPMVLHDLIWPFMVFYGKISILLDLYCPFSRS